MFNLLMNIGTIVALALKPGALANAIRSMDVIDLMLVPVSDQTHGFNQMTYNYSGGRVPNMTIFGTPADVPVPDLPTSIPNSYSDNTFNDVPNYAPPTFKQSIFGLPQNTILLQNPISDTGGDAVSNAQDLDSLQQSCFLCDFITSALESGDLHPAAIVTTNQNISTNFR